MTNQQQPAAAAPGQPGRQQPEAVGLRRRAGAARNVATSPNRALAVSALARSVVANGTGRAVAARRIPAGPLVTVGRPAGITSPPAPASPAGTSSPASAPDGPLTTG